MRFKNWIFVFSAILCCSCLPPSTSTPSPTSADTTYLTPIPQETISAFLPNIILEHKWQAVIFARRKLSSPPHFKPVGTPVVRYAEEMRLQDAFKLTGSGSYNPPTWVEDAQAWLVIFESDIQVIVPLKLTPNPPFHDCSYVLILKDNRQENGGIVGGFNCARVESGKIIR